MNAKLPGRSRMLSVKTILAVGALIFADMPATGQAYDPAVGEMLLDCAGANWVLGHLAKNKAEADDYFMQGAAFMTSFSELAGRKADMERDVKPRGNRLRAMSPSNTAALFSTCIVVLQVGVVYHRDERK